MSQTRTHQLEGRLGAVTEVEDLARKSLKKLKAAVEDGESVPRRISATYPSVPMTRVGYITRDFP